MALKKIFLTLMLISNGITAIAAQEIVSGCLTAEMANWHYPVNNAIEAIGTPVDDMLIVKAEWIAHKLGIKKMPLLRQPSEKNRTDFPVFNYMQGCPAFGYIFINQEWFNQLDQEEQEFALGNMLEKIDSSTTIARNKMIFTCCWFIGQLAIAAALYKFAPAALKQYKKTLWAMIIGSLVGLDMTHDKVAQTIAQKQLANRLKKVAIVLDCKNGAISYLKKLQIQLEPQYKANEHYWKQVWQALPSMITTLETA